MNWRHHMKVLPYGFLSGIKQSSFSWGDTLGSYLIYIPIVVLYSGVLKQIPMADIAPHGLTHAQMIWYLATTEYLLFTISSWGFKDFQNEYKSGEIQLALLRPYPDSFLRLSMWAGTSVFRGLLLFPVYVGSAFLCAGSIEMSFLHFLGLLASMPMAIFIMQIGIYFVGASCLWFVQSEPAYWLWQKSNFLLGAMLWPMLIYPDWAQSIMWFLPFSSLLAFAGEWTLDLSPLRYAAHFAHQALWAVLFFFALRKLDNAIIHHLQRGNP